MKLVQGDVIIRKIKKLPAKVTRLICKNKILQESEITGHHHHFLPTADVDLYTSKRDINNLKDLTFTTITPDEGKYIEVHEDNTILFHGRDFEYDPNPTGTGDHKALTLDKGIYEISITKEYDYDRMEEAYVVD